MMAETISLEQEVRYAVDTVLRRRIIHQTYFNPPDRYAEMLDEMTTEIMGCIRQSQEGK
jgi:hypothetical protein